MIKASDLRIGNLVHYFEVPGGQRMIGTIDATNGHDDMVIFKEENDVWGCANAEGIPLTEEWLERMGFMGMPWCDMEWSGHDRKGQHVGVVGGK